MTITMITKMTIMISIIISIIELLVVRFNEKGERGLSYLIGTKNRLIIITRMMTSGTLRTRLYVEIMKFIRITKLHVLNFIYGFRE